MATEEVSTNGMGGDHRAPLAGADEEVGVLPTDMLYEVLLRLPANVLCRLRLVCRCWRSITSDPTFIKAHSSRHPLVVSLQPAAGDIYSSEVRLVDVSGNIVKRMSTGQYCGYIDSLSTDHDLLCISGSFPAVETCVIDSRTGCVTVLPTNTRLAEQYDVVVNVVSVIGQVPCTGEYKVLRLYGCYFSNSDDEHEQATDIITLGTRTSLKAVSTGRPVVRVSEVSRHIAVVEGVAYFLQYQDDLGIKFKADVLVSFDLNREEWSRSTHRGPINGLPSCCADDDGYRRTESLLTNLNGCLVAGFINTCNHCNNCSIDLWLSMDMEKGLWTKRYSLQYGYLWFQGESVLPLMVLDDEKVLIWASWIEALKAFDPKTSESIDFATVETRFHSVIMYQGNIL